MHFFKKLSYHPLLIKIFHWEYWPFAVLYAPIYPYWFWLCLKARAFFYVNAANPGIRNGGFLMESKKEIYDLLPENSYPETLFFEAGTSAIQVLEKVRSKAVSYPLIGKPDIGMRGMSVQKLENDQDLLAYARKSKVDFLIQAYIPYENELGIFYYRLPNETHGRITGIVGKEFLTVIGDGTSTIEELLQQNQRFLLQLPVLRKNIPEELTLVLQKEERKLLVPYGNHARGAKFIDVTYLADEKLNTMVDELAKQIKGFFYGRMDVRYHTIEELRAGKNFSIIELNGSGSEPTHMYDPRHSVFFAWKEITRHWAIMYTISKQNHEAGVPYMSRQEGLAMLKANTQLVKDIS